MSEKKGSQRRKPDDDRQVGAEGRQSARSPLSLDRSGGGGGGRTKQAGNHVPRAGEKGDTAITPLTYFSPARARGGRWEEEEEDGGGLEGGTLQAPPPPPFLPLSLSLPHVPTRSSCRRPKCVPPSRFPARAAAAAAATNSSVISRYLPPLPPPHTHTHSRSLKPYVQAPPFANFSLSLSLPPSTFPSSPAVSHQAGEKREGRGGKTPTLPER